MVYTVILLVVISSLLTMVMCFIDKRAELDNQPEKRIKRSYVLISSALLGSLGVLFAYFFFDYQSKNWKFILINLIIMMIQAIVIYIILTK
jgi:uncharacterized membrane protein YsdA (DUF1294 family)